MINGLEGIPGSGKSYEAVAMHVLPTLAVGRKVITNLPLLVEFIEALSPDYVGLVELRTRPQAVRGVWDAAAVDDKGNGDAFKLFDGAALAAPLQGSVFGSVWDYYSDWKHPKTGQGPLFIIDEAHLALPTVGTNPEVIEWFKLHRHFNCDVLLATQSFRDLNQPIARLIALIIKCRKGDILGLKNQYIRKVHAGYRGAVISTEERKYKPEIFTLYRSHTQGNSVSESAATDVLPFIVKFRRFTRVFIGVTLCYCAWVAYKYFSAPVNGKPVPALSVLSPSVLPPLRPSSSPLTPAPVVDSQKMVAAADNPFPEPYASKGLHVTGRMTLGQRVMYTFAVSSGAARIGQVTSDELQKIGYVWSPLTDCAGTLTWHGTVKALTCDAPAIPDGSSTAPVVITLPAGASGPTARSDALSPSSRSLL